MFDTNIRHVRKTPLRGALVSAMLFLGGVSACTSAEEHPPAIKQAVGAGMQIVKSFPAGSGLTGWVMSQGTNHSIVYTTADKQTLLVGTLIDAEGENLSARHEEEFMPKPDLSGLYDELGKASYVTEGPATNPKNAIYVFVDANCPFCHMLWRALQPYEKAGLQVRWLLVDTLGPTSMPKAVEVLAAPDKTAAFRKMEENHGKPWNQTAFSAESYPVIAEGIRHNNDLLGRFGLGGTPGIVWKDEDGNVNVKAGMPRLSELPGITRLPEQKITDPALARFR